MINFTLEEFLLTLSALIYIVGVLMGSAAKGYRFARLFVSLPFLSFVIFDAVLFVQRGQVNYALIAGAVAIIETMIVSYRFGVTKRKRVLMVNDDLFDTED